MIEDRFVDYHQKDKTFYPLFSYERALYIKCLHTTCSFHNIFCSMRKWCKVIDEFFLYLLEAEAKDVYVTIFITIDYSYWI